MGFVVLTADFLRPYPWSSRYRLIGANIYTMKGLFLRVYGFLSAMVLLLVNYQGSEIIGLAAGES